MGLCFKYFFWFFEFLIIFVNVNVIFFWKFFFDAYFILSYRVKVLGGKNISCDKDVGNVNRFFKEI